MFATEEQSLASDDLTDAGGLLFQRVMEQVVSYPPITYKKVFEPVENGQLNQVARSAYPANLIILGAQYKTSTLLLSI